MLEVTRKKIMQLQYLWFKNKAYAYPDLRIAVTYYCNNDCSYCSYQHKKQSAAVMNMETFQTVLAWLKKQRKKWLVITGGEPFTHPHIAKMFELLSYNNFRAHVQTNGLLVDKQQAEALKKKQIFLIVNVNINDTFDKVAQNAIDNKEKVVLFRYNIPRENVSYVPLFQLAKTCRVPIRFGYTVPAWNGENEHVSKKEIFLLADRIAEFLHTAKRFKVDVHLARPVPQCMYTQDQWRNLVRMYGFKSRCLIGDGGNFAARAIVNPDASVYVCYGGFYQAPSLFNFYSTQELGSYFREKIDTLRNRPLMDKCLTCDAFEKKECQGGCLVYKAKQDDKE